MKGIAQKIIIAVVGLFFMLSACEISTGYFHNTFDDDYDYYIQPDNSTATNLAIKFFADFIFDFVPVIYESHLVENLFFDLSTPSYYHYSSLPIYIKNCTYLI